MRIAVDVCENHPLPTLLAQLVKAFQETPLGQRIALRKIRRYLRRFILFERSMRAVPPPQFIERNAPGQHGHPGKGGALLCVVARRALPYAREAFLQGPLSARTIAQQADADRE